MPQKTLGEFDLIDRIIARLGRGAADDILVPPGDDAAVWLTEAGAIVATVDTLAEGTHWRADLMSMSDVGWRAVATSVSDLAAMGAEPAYLLVAALIGPGLSTEDIDGFAEGMGLAARYHGARVAGGDIVRARTTAFAVTAIGRARTDAEGRPLLLRRDAACPGDVVAVSGAPGAAAAGLALIEQGRAGDPSAQALVARFRRPRARLALGEAAIHAGLRCAIDLSDGLLQDLGHVAKRSNAGIEVWLDALPLHPSVVWSFGAQGALDLALGGGDDYELALTGPAATLEALVLGEHRLHIIGRVVAEHPGRAIAIDASGGEYEPASRGWDQLRQAPA